MMEHLVQLFSGILAVISIYVGYLVGRRKTKAEAASIELANVEHAIKIWRGIAEDLSIKVQDLTHNLDALRQENEQLKKDIHALHKRFGEYTKNKNNNEE